MTVQKVARSERGAADGAPMYSSVGDVKVAARADIPSVADVEYFGRREAELLELA